MLQTRFENEQFNSLANLFSNTRSRNDYITTDRPDSSKLVDLHIYLIPKSIWRNVQHSAQNAAMNDAISAGFVRVSPDVKLYKLRESIEQLCRKELYFPREFLFLRSVGRCLTRVKQTQENELKVKNYRPPQTTASEIYLLEGRHEDYGNTPSASPALSSAGYLFGNRYQHRFNFDDYRRIPSKNSHHYYHKPLYTEKKLLPIMNTNNINSHLPSSGRKSRSKMSPIGSDTPSPNMSVVTSITSRELAKLQEEQERLRQRQAELERMRRAAEEKRVITDREVNERQRCREEKAQAEHDEEERRRKRRRQEKAEAERRRLEQKAEAERRRLEQQELAATKIQASFRGFQERQVFRERQRNIKNNNSRKSSNHSNKTIQKEKKFDIDDDELSDSSHILTRSSIDSTSDVDSNPSRPETRTIKKENRESIHSNSSSLLSMKNIDNENTRSATVTKMRHTDEEILSVTTPDINDEDTYELQRREGDIKRRRQAEEEKRKAKELEDQRRRESNKLKQHEDVESLRIRLQELRTERINAEKIRDEVIRRLKQMHQRITLRRKEARDMWKKKYFHEKKKTRSIEDNSTQLKTELELIHEKTVQIIDNECKHLIKVGCLKEAENGNLLLQITRTQHEIHDLHQKVNQAKLRLTTDIKLRNQAENECRTLKYELSQAKMNLNHFKNCIEV